VRKRFDLFILACAAAIAALWAYDIARHGLLFADFRAFWCAGSLVLAHQNPYAQAPLYACESQPQPFGIFSATGGTAVPAPYPGYVLCAFALFALIPFVPAALLWCALSITALALTARTISSQINVSWIRILAILGVVFSIVALVYGEVAPLIAFAIVAAMWALRSAKWNAACAAYAAIAVLPQIALPVWIATLLFSKSMRWRLVLLGAALVLLELAAGGPAVALSYIRDVLPAHAVAEAARTSQYGTTWIFTALGATPGSAVRLSDALYLCSVIASVWVVRSRSQNDAAQLVIIPVLSAIASAPFIHFSGILLALPSALAVLFASEPRVRTALSFAVASIALPWLAILDEPALLVALSCVAFFVSRDLARRSIPVAFRSTAAAALFGGVVLTIAAHGGPALVAHAAGMQSAMAQSSWANYVESSFGSVWWIAKGVAWFGLWILALCGVLRRSYEQHVASVAIA